MCISSVDQKVTTCRRSAGSSVEQSSAELEGLLEHALQHHAQAEKTLQQRVRQQQTDLQPLHHGLQDSASHQQEQHSCFGQTQVCVRDFQDIYGVFVEDLLQLSSFMHYKDHIL